MEYTLEEIKKHDNMFDAWTIIHGKVYKLGEYVFGHPGGSDLILSNAGGDSTADFEAIHHSSRATYF
jgi:cytochrome b involved in lipid metabolism